MSKTLILTSILALILMLNALHLASALVITNVHADILYPGKEGTLNVEVKNNLDKDVDEVSLSLDLTALPLTSIGSSEDSVKEIDEGDVESFAYTLKAASDAKPGDYNIPYILTYKDSTNIKKGTIGIQVKAKTDLDFTASLDNPIVGEKSKLSLKIINKGLAEARFVSVKITQSGFTLLSEKKVYIGNIDSDDFETAVFDIVLKSQKPKLTAQLDYEDLDGKKQTRDLEIPLTAYTPEKAIELGIKKKNNVPLYIGIIIAIIILWLIIRAIRKRIKRKRSMQIAKGG